MQCKCDLSAGLCPFHCAPDKRQVENFVGQRRICFVSSKRPRAFCTTNFLTDLHSALGMAPSAKSTASSETFALDQGGLPMTKSYAPICSGPTLPPRLPKPIRGFGFQVKEEFPFKFSGKFELFDGLWGRVELDGHQIIGPVLRSAMRNRRCQNRELVRRVFRVKPRCRVGFRSSSCRQRSLTNSRKAVIRKTPAPAAGSSILAVCAVPSRRSAANEACTIRSAICPRRVITAFLFLLFLLMPCPDIAHRLGSAHRLGCGRSPALSQLFLPLRLPLVHRLLARMMLPTL